AVEGFNLNAMDYLVKPFSFERFDAALKKAHDYFNLYRQNGRQSGDENHIYIRADFSLMKISVDSILYIEALDDYLKIYVKDQKTIVARMTMKRILEKLPESKFKRLHRSYIINRDKLTAVKSRSVMVGDKEIPVGGNYASELDNLFK